jgi:hypothetical protein
MLLAPARSDGLLRLRRFWRRISGISPTKFAPSMEPAERAK